MLRRVRPHGPRERDEAGVDHGQHHGKSQKTRQLRRREEARGDHEARDDRDAVTEPERSALFPRELARDERTTKRDRDDGALSDDGRIAAHCKELDVPCMMTSEDCPTGSDRVLEAAKLAGGGFDFLISLQGDAPFTPLAALSGILATLRAKPDTEVATPVIRLDWEQLDKLREFKKTTPFSGTTVIVDETGRALWFSKNIMPAIRKEAEMRKTDRLSPVHQHIGLYAYRADILARFVGMKQSNYEKLEGLEQLRLLENGIKVTTVPVNVEPGALHTGIDSPEDLARAEEFLAGHGATA